jgi:hypothetical protein
MIQSGGWSKLRTIDEHTKLARVALSFSPKLDEAFKINVAKMRVQLPPQARELLEEAVAPVIKLARKTYGKQGSDYAGKPGPAAGKAETRNNNVGISKGKAQKSQTKLWALEELEAQLNSVANRKEQTVLSTVFKRLRTNLNS